MDDNASQIGFAQLLLVHLHPQLAAEKQAIRIAYVVYETRCTTTSRKICPQLSEILQY